MKVVIIDKEHPNYGKLCVILDSAYKDQERLKGFAISATPIGSKINDVNPLVRRDQFISKELFDACATIITSKLLFGRDI